MDKEPSIADFPELLYLLEGYLYIQGDRLEDLLRGYLIANGTKRTKLVIQEIGTHRSRIAEEVSQF